MKTTRTSSEPTSPQTLAEDATSIADRSIGACDETLLPVSSHDFVAHLDRCMQELDSPQREILRMRSGRGLSYEEISARLKLSLDLVKTHLIRARENLRAHLLQQKLFNPDGSVRGSLSVQS